MVHQKGIFVLDLKPLISQCSPCLRVIELPILGLEERASIGLFCLTQGDAGTLFAYQRL